MGVGARLSPPLYNGRDSIASNLRQRGRVTLQWDSLPALTGDQLR